MKRIQILLLFFTTYSQVSFSQLNAYYQQFVDYDMTVDVDVKNSTYKGSQKINYTNNSPDTLKVFYFHLYWNAFQKGSMMDERTKYLKENADWKVITKTSEGIKSKIELLEPNEYGFQEILTLKQNGKQVKFKTNETILEVELAEPILPNTKTTFEMSWNAQIPKQIRRSGRVNSEGIDFSFTQWYPKVVEYDYEGWHTFDYIAREFHGVFGNFNVKISIDSNYVVAAGGQLQNSKNLKGYDVNFKPTKNKKSIWHFKAENIHDFAFGADPDYAVETQQIKDGPLVYYIFQKNGKTELWEQAKPKIQLFYDEMKTAFGKYPYPTYSFIQGGDGGMEYGQCTLILGESKTLKGLLGLMYHEAAHSWFQHVLATNESMRGWMDEGFTSYAEDYCLSKAFPDDVKDYPNVYFESITNYINFSKTGKEEVMALLDDFHNSSKSFSYAKYIKGELFLVQLGYIVGEETLRKIMLEYFNTWKFKHPNDRDFMHIAQKISKMDLKWYFNLMINTTKTIDYAITEVENKNIKLQRIGEFPMPIDLKIEFIDGKINYYTIPLSMMRSEKKTELNKTYELLPDWSWTRTDYSFEIPFEKENIKSILIDETKRMVDVNPVNNIWKP